MSLTRRGFLAGVAASAVLLLGDLPAHAAPGRKLVMVHLFGGNDGLNTLVPRGSARYRRARPSLALAEDALLPLGHGMAAHPALGPLLPHWERGRVAAVQGVGYPDSSLSHFHSTEVWHTAGRDRGWLGATGLEGVGVDPEPTLVLGEALRVRDPQEFRLDLPEPERALLRGLYARHDRLGPTWARMEEGMRRLGRPCPGEAMPPGDAGQALSAVLRLLDTARVFHVTLGGFDTHSGQADRHARALGEAAAALAAFARAAPDTLVVVYSEFGRRVEENASGGTDHGAAGPVLLLGPVRPGLHGEHPSLADLEDGNLRHAVDFRQVYATVLRDWLGLDPNPLLGGSFQGLRLVEDSA